MAIWLNCAIRQRIEISGALLVCQINLRGRNSRPIEDFWKSKSVKFS